jgi:hypothetical protein
MGVSNNDEGDDTELRPVKRLPVSRLTCRIVRTRVRLANGNYIPALISNLDTEDARMNEHFATLSIERKGTWFELARYHDVDYRQRGPNALARFLGLPVNEVFPISYDVGKYVVGDAAALKGTALKKPRTRLTRAKLIAMPVAIGQG